MGQILIALGAELTTSFIMQRANTLHFLIDQNSSSFFCTLLTRNEFKKSELSGLTPNTWAGQNGIWMIFFWNSSTRKDIFRLYSIKGRIFASNLKFSHKNYLLCAWRDYKKEFVVYLHIINESLSHIFHPYSILTR